MKEEKQIKNGIDGKVNPSEETGQKVSEAPAALSASCFHTPCKFNFLYQLPLKKIAGNYNVAFLESNVIEDLYLQHIKKSCSDFPGTLFSLF